MINTALKCKLTPCISSLRYVSVQLLSILLIFILSLETGLYAQNNKVENSITKTTLLEQNIGLEYMQIHEQYKWERNPLAKINSENIDRELDEDFVFYMDTTYVYSVNNNPSRYTNSFDSEWRLINTMKEVINGDDYEYSTKVTYSYDENGNTISILSEKWENSSWENSSRVTNTYSDLNNLISFTSEIWENSNWVNNERGTFLYDTYGNNLAYLKEDWNNGEWNNLTNELYTYDENNNMLTAFGEIWTGTYWLNDQRYTYTYDENNNMLTGKSEYWDDNHWINNAEETYTYNSANKRETFIVEVWVNEEWINQLKYNYTYNNLDFLTSLVGEMWENDSWTNSSLTEITYNPFGGIESEINKVWENDSWLNNTLNQYSYDDYGNALMGDFYYWDNESWSQNQDGLIQMFYNYSSTSKYFIGYKVKANYVSPTVGIINKKKEIISFVCAPNPAYNYTTLIYTSTKDNNASIYLYDVIGKKIQTVYNGNLSSGKHSFTIITEQLPLGTYFVHLETLNTYKTYKILVLK